MSGSGSADGAAALDPRREALAGADDTVTASTSGSGAPFVTVPLSSTPKASEEGAVAAAASEAAGPSSGAAAPGGGASSQQPSPEAFRWASDAEEHDDFEIGGGMHHSDSYSGYYKKNLYCGPLSWLMGICVFGPIVAMFPCDERRVFIEDEEFAECELDEQPQPGMKSKRWVVDVGPTPRSRSALALEENPYDAL